MMWFFTILTVGFLGSWHCGVMCGPLSCSFIKKQQFISYHLGRLISYMVLTVIIYLGSRYFLNSESQNIKASASVIFGIIFIFFGLLQFDLINTSKYSKKLVQIQFRVLKRFKKWADRFPIVLGLLTGLFPCSWLYSFFLLSTKSGSVYSALAVIVLFWLSALPAFAVFTGAMSSAIRHSKINHQKIAGMVLIFAGIFSIFGHWVDVIFLTVL